jgi:hypothetical protein
MPINGLLPTSSSGSTARTVQPLVQHRGRQTATTTRVRNHNNQEEIPRYSYSALGLEDSTATRFLIGRNPKSESENDSQASHCCSSKDQVNRQEMKSSSSFQWSFVHPNQQAPRCLAAASQRGESQCIEESRESLALQQQP